MAKLSGMSNEQFMAKLLSGAFTPTIHPGMIQAFVIDSITKMADRVSVAKPEEVENGLIHGQTWINTAKEVKRVVDEKYSK